jgi:hypothetical protein
MIALEESASRVRGSIEKESTEPGFSALLRLWYQ